MKFYAHESCGQCTPCREGHRLAGARLHAPGEGRRAARRRRAAGQRRATASPATPSARSARRRPGRCSASSPSSAPTSKPSSRKAARWSRRRTVASASRSSSGCWRRSVFGGALFTITRRNPVTAVMSLVGDLLRARRDLRDAVGALPRDPAGAGLRGRHHGALHLRRHDPEPRGGRAGRAARPGRAQPRRRGRSVPGVHLRARRARRRPPATCRSRPRPSAPSRRSAICCSATSCTRSRRSRCCCWSRSSAASSSRARTRRRSPPSRRPSAARSSSSWRSTTSRRWPTTPPMRTPAREVTTACPRTTT